MKRPTVWKRNSVIRAQLALLAKQPRFTVFYEREVKRLGLYLLLPEVLFQGGPVERVPRASG